MPGPSVSGGPEAPEVRGCASRFWVWSRRLLVGLVLCRGLVYLCVMPPFEGWDEYQHVGYVEHVLETGRAAVYGVTNVPTPLLDAAVKLPHPSREAGPPGAVDYASYWERHDPRDPSREPPEFKGEPRLLYQAQHSPLYYRLAAPLFAALGGVADLKRSIGGLRLRTWS